MSDPKVDEQVCTARMETVNSHVTILAKESDIQRKRVDKLILLNFGILVTVIMLLLTVLAALISHTII